MVDESKEDLMAAYKLDPNNKAVRKELQLLKASPRNVPRERLSIVIGVVVLLFARCRNLVRGYNNGSNHSGENTLNHEITRAPSQSPSK